MASVRRLWICVNRFDAPRGRVWAVRYGNRWMTARKVEIKRGLNLETQFNGIDARQPKAYLAGFGVARYGKSGIVEVSPS